MVESISSSNKSIESRDYFPNETYEDDIVPLTARFKKQDCNNILDSPRTARFK